MAKPDKAQITYEVEGVESILRFHTVVAEEHEVATQLTKFPAQSGFNISNHVIRMNRVVTIKGAITNHQVVGAETFNTFDDSKNVVRLMFSVLKDLVRGAVPCEVTTNFGKYSPVIFNKFRTKLVAGKTDTMEFTMRGEEVQLATTINGNKPNLLVFTELTAGKKEARIAEFASAGMEVSPDAVLSEATVDMNESFQLESKDDLGNTSITTYEKVGSDLTSDTNYHLVHTNKVDLTESVDVPEFISSIPELGPSLPNTNLTSGASIVSPCISEGVDRVVSEAAEDEIDTVFGKLESSLYGGKYSVTGVNGDQSLGQAVLGVGVDCFVADTSSTGKIAGSLTNPAKELVNYNLPSSSQILSGASALGDSLTGDTSGKAAPTTITKVSCGC